MFFTECPIDPGREGRLTRQETGEQQETTTEQLWQERLRVRAGSPLQLQLSLNSHSQNSQQEPGQSGGWSLVTREMGRLSIDIYFLTLDTRYSQRDRATDRNGNK